MSLFDTAVDQWQRIELPDADLQWLPQWLPPADADALMDELRESVAWEVHRIQMFGRRVDCPRLSCWIGDAQARYRYSGTQFDAQPWTPALQRLRDRVAEACGARFNSVLANLYRDGSDTMGWHSDDEAELGAQPVIASLSLGAERGFALRRRVPPGVSRRGMPAPLRLPLPHGSLLRMAGATQRCYQHALPAVRAMSAPRINLTFRWISSC